MQLLSEKIKESGICNTGLYIAINLLNHLLFQSNLNFIPIHNEILSMTIVCYWQETANHLQCTKYVHHKQIMML